MEQHSRGISTGRHRTVRPTLRALVDLGLEVPGIHHALADLEHPVLAKARELAASFPQNAVRIQGIRADMVYRFTHGRHRVAAWLDETAEILWVCACELRGDDTYDVIIALYDGGSLLPSDSDDDRLAREAGLLLGRALVEHVPDWVRDAREHDGHERQFHLAGGIEIRMLCRRDESIEEFWLAVPTLTADVPGLSPNARAMVAALVEQELGDSAVWETRYDWPTGGLRSWEVARLGIGEA